MNNDGMTAMSMLIVVKRKLLPLTTSKALFMFPIVIAMNTNLSIY